MVNGFSPGLRAQLMQALDTGASGPRPTQGTNGAFKASQGGPPVPVRPRGIQALSAAAPQPLTAPIKSVQTLPGLAATRDGSHQSGAGLLPYLNSYSGVSGSDPQWQMTGGQSADTPVSYSPNVSIGGLQGLDSGGGLDAYLSRVNPGANLDQPDWMKYYTPGTSTGQYADDMQTTPGTFDSAGATQAYNAWQSSLASQNGLDPNSKYFYAASRTNPTSAPGSNDEANILYKLDASGNAVPVDAQNQHNGSMWTDFVRPSLIGSLGVIGAGFGAAAAYGGLAGAGAAGAEGGAAGVGGGGISADSATYGALENGAAYGGGAGDSLVASSASGLPEGALQTVAGAGGSGAATDAAGMALAEGAYPASVVAGDATAGILGSGLTAEQLAQYGLPAAKALSGMDSANDGSDAHFYQSEAGGTGVQDLGNMGGSGSAQIPSFNLSNPGLTDYLRQLLTTQNAGSTPGLSGIGRGLLGAGIGALTNFGQGDTSLLNRVNYGDAATAQGQSQRTNQTNAQGSLTYNQSGVDAQGHPTYSQNVSLNAPYQQNLDSALSNQGTALGNLGAYNQSLPGAYASVPGLYGDAGSQSALAKQQQDAMYDAQRRYLDPQYDLQSKQLDAQLANQGVTYGSDAYNAAKTQFGSQQNQAYGAARDSAINSGNAYANTLFNQNLAAHNAGMADINSQGSNYLNQSSGALSGVTQNPTFAATPQTPTPYLTGAQLQGNANLNQYNAQIGNTNNLTNGLTGIGQNLFSNPGVWSSIGSGLSGLFGGGG